MPEVAGFPFTAAGEAFDHRLVWIDYGFMLCQSAGFLFSFRDRKSMMICLCIFVVLVQFPIDHLL
jgi:hypothetical protein